MTDSSFVRCVYTDLIVRTSSWCSPFTVHRSPFTVHRSPFTVHRSPFTVLLRLVVSRASCRAALCREPGAGMFAEDSLDTKSLSLVAVAALSWLWCCGVVVVVHDCACQRKTGVQKVNVLEARWPSLTQHLCSERTFLKLGGHR